MRDNGALHACRAAHETPASQHTRHFSSMCSKIFLETVSRIVGNAARIIYVYMMKNGHHNVKAKLTELSQRLT